MTQPIQAHLPTPKAAIALGISISTLNRFCGAEADILKEGEHWCRRNRHTNATKIFDIPVCISTLSRLGYYIPQETRAALEDVA